MIGRKDGGKAENEIKRERKNFGDSSHSGQNAGGGQECTHKPRLTHSATHTHTHAERHKKTWPLNALQLDHVTLTG